MEVKRFIKKVRTSQLNIDLPPSFINRDIEILIMTLDKPIWQKRFETYWTRQTARVCT